MAVQHKGNTDLFRRHEEAAECERLTKALDAVGGALATLSGREARLEAAAFSFRGLPDTPPNIALTITSNAVDELTRTATLLAGTLRALVTHPLVALSAVIHPPPGPVQPPQPKGSQ